MVESTGVGEIALLLSAYWFVFVLVLVTEASEAKPAPIPKKDQSKSEPPEPTQPIKRETTWNVDFFGIKHGLSLREAQT